MRESQNVRVDQWGFGKRIFRWDGHFSDRLKLHGLCDLLEEYIPRREQKKRFTNVCDPPKTSHGVFRKMRDLSAWLLSACTTSLSELAHGRGHIEKKILAKIRERCGPFIANIDQPLVSWMGHSTFLLQIFGITLLTDPVWSSQVGPYPISLCRSCPAPIALEALNKVDFVLVSHNHADHFDLRTLSALSKTHSQPQLIVPEGMGAQVEHLGLDFVELSWGETCRFSCKNESTIIDVSSIPVIHHSGRGIFDKNASAWCGWLCSVQKKNGEKKTFFYSGDTAFSEPLFHQIGKQFGPLDLSLLPVGAYFPRSLLTSSHIDPAEAVQIHKLIRSKKSIACHHSTFRLSHFVEEEKRLLNDFYAGLEKHHVPEHEFAICPMGYWMNW